MTRESFADARNGESDLTALVAAAMAEVRPALVHRLSLHSAESIVLGAWNRGLVQQGVVSLLTCVASHACLGSAIEVLLETVGERVYVDVVFEAEASAMEALEEGLRPRDSIRGVATANITPNDLVAAFGAFVHRHGGRLWATSDKRRIVATLELDRHRAIEVTEDQLPFLTNLPAPDSELGAGTGAMRPPPAWAHHVRDSRVRALLTMWRALDTEHTIPRIRTLGDPRLCAWQHEMCFARVQQLGHEHVLSLDEVGGALERRIGVALSRTRYVLTTSPQISFLDEFIRRYALARASGTPQFDYAQFVLDDGVTERFERLVLPFSEGGAALPTHFVAMMRFAGIRTAERRHFIRIVTNHDV